MKTKLLRSLILLATLSVVGIIIAQIYVINANLNIQKDYLKIQYDQLTLDKKKFEEQQKIFNDRVTIALSHITEKILNIYNDPSQIYNNVKQLDTNFFVVRINDTLHPALLERLLKNEFDLSNIKEDFQYAIYDCFDNSVVFEGFVSFDSTKVNDNEKNLSDVQWEQDGHYFSVFFPNKPKFKELVHPIQIESSQIWFYTVIIIVIVFVFFGYAVWVILKQKRLSDVKNDFINNMTHELKTPISTISISSEVLLKPNITDDPERVNQYARIIYNENKRLENQVERVLQLATLDKEKIVLKKTILDIHELISQAAENFKPAIQSVGGKIELELNAKDFNVEGDKVHISNIINNLLDNARKYSEQAPEIIIKTSNEKNGICISIKDNGIGISAEAQKQIFDKFYRVPTGNVHNVKGFGLGLYYVKYMLEEHGGRVRVESRARMENESESGTTFIVYLPF